MKKFALFNIILLGIVSLLTDLSSEMIRPILPSFLISLGSSAFIIGFIGGLMEAMPNFLKVFSGYFSDRFRKRKLFIFSGYGLSAISKFVLAIIKNWQQAIAVIFFERSGKGIRDAPRDALIAESIKARGFGFGIHRALDSLGAILGSVIALILIFIGFKVRSIILIAAIISLFSLLPIIFVKEIRKKREKVGFVKELRSFPKKLKLFFLVSGIFALANFSYMFFILKAQIFSNSLALNIPSLAIPTALYVLFNIFYASFSIPLGKLADKIGKKKVIAFGYFLFSLTCLAFIFSSNIAFFIALFITYGISMAAIDANQRAYTSELAKSKLGFALGSYHTFIGLLAFASSLIAGALWQINASLTFAYGFILSLISAILFLILIKNN